MPEDEVIEWMDQAEFYAWFERECPPRGLYLTLEIFFSASREALARAVPGEPVEDPTDQDEAGPCVRWYGRVGDTLFWLTHYDDPYQDLAVLMTRGKTAEEPYRWSVLESLTCLPAPILQNITSVFWHLTKIETAQLRETPREPPAAVVAFIDEHLIKHEAFAAETLEEAQALRALLERIGSRYDYFITEPEQFDADWIVLKGTPGERENCVARYPWRVSAEKVARIMSLNDDYTYRAQEAGGREQRGMSFRHGKACVPETPART